MDDTPQKTYYAEYLTERERERKRERKLLVFPVVVKSKREKKDEPKKLIEKK